MARKSTASLTPSSSIADSNEPETWAVKAIVGEEYRTKKGKRIRWYEVNWEGDWPNSWEPASNVGDGAIAAWKEKKREMLGSGDRRKSSEQKPATPKPTKRTTTPKSTTTVSHPPKSSPTLSLTKPTHQEPSPSLTDDPKPPTDVEAALNALLQAEPSDIDVEAETQEPSAPFPLTSKPITTSSSASKKKKYAVKRTSGSATRKRKATPDVYAFAPDSAPDTDSDSALSPPHPTTTTPHKKPRTSKKPLVATVKSRLSTSAATKPDHDASNTSPPTQQLLGTFQARTLPIPVPRRGSSGKAGTTARFHEVVARARGMNREERGLELAELRFLVRALEEAEYLEG